jgi:hypothetical protein
MTAIVVSQGFTLGFHTTGSAFEDVVCGMRQGSNKYFTKLGAYRDPSTNLMAQQWINEM